MKKPTAVIILSLSLFFVLACGTLQVSLETTPTPDVGATSTVGALQTQNAELATRIAAVPAPVFPTLAPATAIDRTEATSTAAPPPATRITFLSGATVGVVSAPIAPGQVQTYIVDVFQQQPMYVYLASTNGDVTVSIVADNGTTVLAADAKQNAWQGLLQQTGDYYLTIHAGVAVENFTLTVTIPSRIQFLQGATSATVSGNTVAGYNVSYTIYAAKGQSMRVDLENLSSKASLSVYGFTDGHRYLRSDAGETTFRLSLPLTQDYIIVVVPMPGLEVSYTVTITVQ